MDTCIHADTDVHGIKQNLMLIFEYGNVSIIYIYIYVYLLTYIFF